jgi:hypothetical protein
MNTWTIYNCTCYSQAVQIPSHTHRLHGHGPTDQYADERNSTTLDRQEKMGQIDPATTATFGARLPLRLRDSCGTAIVDPDPPACDTEADKIQWQGHDMSPAGKGFFLGSSPEDISDGVGMAALPYLLRCHCRWQHLARGEFLLGVASSA